MVVLSSDDEDTDRSLSSNRRRTRSSSRLSSTAPPKNPGRAKKARVSGSRSSLGSVSTNWDEVICEFLGFNLNLTVQFTKKNSYENLMLGFNVTQVRLSFEDFDEVFSGSKVPAGMPLLKL